METQIWDLKENALCLQVKKGQIHTDDLEMSGFYSDYIVSYGVKEDGTLHLTQSCYFPTLRTIPNNTHGTFSVEFDQEDRVGFLWDGMPVMECVRRFILDGTLVTECDGANGLKVTRRFYPAARSRCCIQRVTLCAERDMVICPARESGAVCYRKGTKGVYVARLDHTIPETVVLKKNEEQTFFVYYSANLANENPPLPDGERELEKRRERIRELCEDALVLDSGNPILDRMMRFAKLRAGESIFETLSGKFHSPGGRAYYAATWCNDQIEYAGPHFAMTGDKDAIEASLNAYLSYIPFMSDAYIRLPSSIIAEGLDIWQGAGDRGDAAMYLYGASLFCLYLGDANVAKRLYPAICWCSEYCEKKKTPEGVIGSDTDELEGRFPTDGYANLSTSCLCYGGLLAAAKLARSLGKIEDANKMEERARHLFLAIENYFGAELHGYKTYRYSKGFDTLRAWICLPLCVGLNTRAEGTLDAMLSRYLWTEEGMLTCEYSAENQSSTIWDRSTLYGMKCAFLAGAGERMTAPLLAYCRKRLLGDRVPYAVEAYPEGDKRHLSGESALFVRVISEGLFGIAPESLDSFSFVPNLPTEFDHLYLYNIRICGSQFDIKIDKDIYRVFENGKEIAGGNPDGTRVIIRKKI